MILFLKNIVFNMMTMIYEYSMVYYMNLTHIIEKCCIIYDFENKV